MKKLVIYLIPILSLVFFYGCAPQVALQAAKTPQDVVLTSFRFHIDDFNSDAFYGGNYANLFMSVGRPSPYTADLTMLHELYSKKQNQLIKQQVDSAYAIIRQKLSRENLNILPVNTLRGEAEYDPYGFPIYNNSKNVYKKAKLALSVNIYLDEDDIIRTFNYPHDFQSQYTPRLTLVMKLVNSSGKVVWNEQAIEFSNREMITDNYFQGGISNLTIEQTPSLANMVNRALNDILRRKGIKPKKKHYKAKTLVAFE